MRRVPAALLKQPFPSSIRALSSLPPPELVQPFSDLSDVVSTPQPSPWVPQILSLLDGSHSMESNLTTFCHKFLITLSPSFVAHTLRSLSDPLTATRFFSWATTQRNYSHSLDCHVSLLPFLLHDPAALRRHLDHLKRFPFTLPAANSLVKTLAAAGLVDELLWVFGAMRDAGLTPNLQNYNSLLNALVNATLVDSAARVFAAMPKPDIVSYNTLIKGYCKVGRTQDVFALIREMEVGNVLPDEVTYMTLIQACYNENDVDCCLRLYNEMVDKGIVVPPHAISLVVCGLCKQGKVVEGCAVFESMVRRGCRVNKAVYTAIIDGYAKSGDLDAAMAFFERMKVDGLEPDEVTYGAVVSGLCKGGRIEEAMGYFGFCKGSGVAVNAVFYSSLIDGLGKVGRVDEEMVEERCPQDSYCYNALMDGLCKSGRIDEALALYTRMGREGCEQTVYTFTILIS